MTYGGKVNNGQIVPDDSVRLPEEARVRVQVVRRKKDKPAPQRTGRQILRLPIAERRLPLLHQSRRVAPLYAEDSQRMEWQGGDILE